MIKWTAFIFALSGMSTTVYAVDQDALLKEAREIVSKFSHQLKKARKHGLSEGGEVKALEVCHLQAPDIASDLSDKTNWVVRRTTLKTRDLDNAPDKWETKSLEEFERRQAAGELRGNREYSEIVENDNKRVFRYMKAITLTKGCLKCHGKSIHSEVSKELDSLYPFDQATGYSEGDLRGAYTLSKVMGGAR
jgi:hypothetical protein